MVAATQVNCTELGISILPNTYKVHQEVPSTYRPCLRRLPEQTASIDIIPRPSLLTPSRPLKQDRRQRICPILALSAGQVSESASFTVRLLFS